MGVQEWTSHKEAAVVILEDMGNEVVARWLQVTASAGSTESPSVVSRQSSWKTNSHSRKIWRPWHDWRSISFCLYRLCLIGIALATYGTAKASYITMICGHFL